MIEYFIMRLEDGKINYNIVAEKYPQYKDEIDLILASDGYKVNKNGTVIKL